MVGAVRVARNCWGWGHPWPACPGGGKKALGRAAPPHEGIYRSAHDAGLDPGRSG